MTGQEMTLWQTLAAGGMVMVVIGLLSIIALSLIAYDFWTLNVDKLIPRTFYEDLIRKMEKKDWEEARTLCIRDNNLIGRIVLAGLEKLKKDPRAKASAQEAVEYRARIEIGNLWQNINYLSDIVAVAPLLGLLGTVLGMIEAFHAVPLQSAALKTTLLAAGISKAMVTTASSLIIAIPVLAAYSYFRGRVQNLTNIIEMHVTDITKMMDKN